MAKPQPSQSTRPLAAISDLEQGAYFRWQDAVWEVDVHTGCILAYREGGFGSRATFYDPVTAAKAGELSWTTLVEPL